MKWKSRRRIDKTAKKRKATQKAPMIARLQKKIFKDLKRAEPERVKAAKAAKAKK